MEKINYLSKKCKEFFNQKADYFSIITGFIKRHRKLTGSSFVKALVIGNINSNCSINNLCHWLNEELLDSTYITLPNNMENIYKGYRASYPGFESSTKSAIKLQLLFDYLNQTLTKLEITAGVRSDQDYRGYLDNILPNDLLIADLGYFVPESFKKIDNSKAYFISRYKANTNLYDIKTKQKINLVDLLVNKSFLEQEIILGKAAQLKVRIICKKLPKELSTSRRRKANKLAKARGYKSSEYNQKLLDWSIFITNILEEKINADQLLAIYRSRWQIELLFKLYKSHIRIDSFQSKKPSRVLCEFYAKLCIIIIFHGLSNCIILAKDREISLTKAYIFFKKYIRELHWLVGQPLNKLKCFLKKLITVWTKFALKDKCSKNKISTLETIKLLTVFP